MDINELFDNRQVKKASNPRLYDVRITLNKRGGDRFAIRFGFLNNAVKAFKGKSYVQVSKVAKLPTKIYFRLFDSRANLDAHKLCTNSHSETSNLYTTITPTAEAEKIYRTKWIGKDFKIKFDEGFGLYYIELNEEA